MKPPTPRARLILDQYKQGQSLANEQRGRLLGVILERGARGDLPRFDLQATQPALPTTRWPLRIWASPLGKIVTVSLLAGLPVAVLQGTREAADHPRPAETAASDARSVDIAVSPPQPAAEARVNDLAAPPSPPQPSAPPSVNTRTRPERSSDAPAPPGPGEATIDEEVRLLNAAQTSLRSGDAGKALQLLNEHASRFPASKLANARAVAHMMALCKVGETSLARQEADRFLIKYPNSPFTERVREICLHPSRP